MRYDGTLAQTLLQLFHLFEKFLLALTIIL